MWIHLGQHDVGHARGDCQGCCWSTHWENLSILLLRSKQHLEVHREFLLRDQGDKGLVLCLVNVGEGIDEL